MWGGSLITITVRKPSACMRSRTASASPQLPELPGAGVDPTISTPGTLARASAICAALGYSKINRWLYPASTRSRPRT